MADFLFETLLTLCLPLVYLYHAATDNLFLNVAAEEATGLEKAANELLAPYQFVFWGRVAHLDAEGRWQFAPRFAIDERFWIKMGTSIMALPVSFVLGTAAKTAAFLSPEVRARYHAMKHPPSVVSMREKYLAMGVDLSEGEWFSSMGYSRREGDENYFSEDKRGLQEIADRLNAAGIVWWVDCGTLLGAYRYGGIIPWDMDIDIAFLLPDFDNVLSALSTLDPNQFLVQDWSSRERPKTYLKVYNRKTGREIDLYFFAIDAEKREIRYILSLENHLFMPEWWHIRERRFKVPTSFDTMFPLKKGLFDGIEVPLPHDPKTYLQLRYGEDLAPAKIYNSLTGQYEKDLSHPYWQRAYVH